MSPSQKRLLAGRGTVIRGHLIGANLCFSSVRIQLKYHYMDCRMLPCGKIAGNVHKLLEIGLIQPK